MENSYPTLTKDSIYTILSERFNNQFFTLKDLPHPSTFKDMDRAVERIIEAIKNSEKIALIGDYDVDGVISTSIMVEFFKEIDVDLMWIIPNRFEDGYGLSLSLIPKIENYDLVITVDNGISAVEAAKKCQELGIDLIITDHHIVPSPKPDAYAIVDQKQSECTFEYEEVCGAQIAWYLCSAINIKLGRKIDMRGYLDLVSIAIIADIMPLQHINRAMVHSGIARLNSAQRDFVKAYKEHSNKEKITSEDIAFALAPILNSAGRLEDASLAVEYILSTNIYDARSRLQKLVLLNDRRKEIEQQITNEASRMVDSNDDIIVVSSDNWHEGVVGIVAARLAKKFERAAIVLNCSDDICKGSGRSFGDCNLFELVKDQKEMLDKFGGHRMAIGLSIAKNRIEEFHNLLNSSAKEICKQKNFVDHSIIGKLPFSEINFDLLDMIEKFEPYGEGNSKPKFVSTNVEILAVQTMGKDANHLRFTFRDGEYIHNAVQFKTYENYQQGDKVDIIYTLNKNSFRSKISIQLMVEKVEKVENKFLY